MRRLTRINEGIADEIADELVGMEGSEWVREAEQSLIGRLVCVEPPEAFDRKEQLNPMGNRITSVKNEADRGDGNGACILTVSGRTESLLFDVEQKQLRPLTQGKPVSFGGYSIRLR